MIKIKIIKDTEKCKRGEIVQASKKNAESYVKNGYAEYINKPKVLSKKTIKKLIAKEAKKFRDKNPKVKKAIKKVRKQKKMDEKPKKLDTETIGEYIKSWASMGMTLEVIASIKKASKNSDFTIQELKELVKKEISEIEKPVEEEQIRSLSVREQYLEYIRDKKWGEASEILVDYVLKHNHIYTTKDDNKSEIWVYEDGIYTDHGKSQIKKILRNLLGTWYSVFVFNNVIAKIEPDTFINSQDFFSVNYKDEVPIQNGILNIFTREISPFTPTKIFFNKLPVKYNPEAKCEKINEFLETILSNKEDKDVFYEIGGFTLLKEYTFEKAFMFVGNGRNGKGKSLELLKRMIGAENCYSLPLSALDSQNADVHQLFGKMINMAGDIGSKDLKDTSMFKGLTGRDLITTKRKFLNALTFENYAKFVFACNDLPMVYDTSKGFWDRWVLLEFPYYFADKEEFEKATEEQLKYWKLRDEDIINKIISPEELSGLLNKCLDGLDRLLKNRKFSSTKGSEEVKNTWIRKSNSFMAFCIDLLEEDYDTIITKKDLRKKYMSYCKEHKVSGKSDFVIKRVLQEMFGAIDDRQQIFENYEYVWKGVKFKC